MYAFTQRQAILASWIIVFTALYLVLPLKLLPSLLAGLLVYELVNTLAGRLQRHLPGGGARWLAVALLGALVVSLLTLFFVWFTSFIIQEVQNPGRLLDKFMVLTERARTQLPPSLDAYLPANADGMKRELVEWIRAHVAQLQLFGRDAARTFVIVLIGMILGAIVALQPTPDPERLRPLSGALLVRLGLVAQAFRNIVFAQIKISLLNTTLTGIFLLGVLPLFDVHLPLAKTLVILTFILGLLPVIGNLMSNTLIFIAGLSLSIWVAIAALGYLIAIHKLEYFLNARIVGGQISARSWELLVAMLVFEAAFGLPGLVAAPVYYAYLKSELKAEGLV
ncbi:AI-2E family transporter [uncultured Pseudomonas sp.]|uniref:AI-2E family transporter n=1 Tax=uncultured Pseudomonas sp. TaxID=114707 RepID=UPI0025F43843|nr:AI-2E family transporter [uncultured Pseudomonas sp.]